MREQLRKCRTWLRRMPWWSGALLIVSIALVYPVDRVPQMDQDYDTAEPLCASRVAARLAEQFEAEALRAMRHGRDAAARGHWQRVLWLCPHHAGFRHYAEVTSDR